MSNQKFYDIGNAVLVEAQLKELESIEKQWQHAKENMFNAISALFGHDLAEAVRTYGISNSVEGVKAVIYGEYAFAPYGNNGWCNGTAMFKFAVIQYEDEGFSTLVGFVTVDNVADLTRQVDKHRRELERKEALERAVKTIKIPFAVSVFNNATRRFSENHPLPIDRLMLAFYCYSEEMTGDFDGSDDIVDYDDSDSDE